MSHDIPEVVTLDPLNGQWTVPAWDELGLEAHEMNLVSLTHQLIPEPDLVLVLLAEGGSTWRVSTIGLQTSSVTLERVTAPDDALGQIGGAFVGVGEWAGVFQLAFLEGTVDFRASELLVVRVPDLRELDE